MRNRCPDEETLMDFVEGRLPERQRARMQSHLSICDPCREQAAVCAALVYGSQPIDDAQAPERLTRRAVNRVARLRADARGRHAAGRTRRWVVRGMAVFERLVAWDEPVPVALRGETVVSAHSIRRQKRFGDLQVTIEIETSGTAQALIRVTPAAEAGSVGAPVRVTLFKGTREAASMLLGAQPVIFEDIEFGVYTLVFSRGATIGEYTFEIAEPHGDL